MKQLADLFHDRLSLYQTAINTSGHLLRAADIPRVPPVVFSNDILVQHRERYLPNGKIDNLVIQFDRSSSTALGLWILSVLFDPSAGSRSVKLPSSEVVNEIKMIVDTQAREPAIESFTWVPRIGTETIQTMEKCSKATIRLTNEDDDWFDEAGYRDRNILLGFGDTSGALTIADFFLNFGLLDNDLNYESLYHRDEPGGVLDDYSCELRVEVKSC